MKRKVIVKETLSVREILKKFGLLEGTILNAGISQKNQPKDVLERKFKIVREIQLGKIVKVKKAK